MTRRSSPAGAGGKSSPAASSSTAIAAVFGFALPSPLPGGGAGRSVCPGVATAAVSSARAETHRATETASNTEREGRAGIRASVGETRSGGQFSRCVQQGRRALEAHLSGRLKCGPLPHLLACADAPRSLLPDAPCADAAAAGAGGDGPGALAAGPRGHLALLLGARAAPPAQRAHGFRGAPAQAQGAAPPRALRGRADALDGVVAGQRLLRPAALVLGRRRAGGAGARRRSADAALAGARSFRAFPLWHAVRRARPAARARGDPRRGPASRMAWRPDRATLRSAFRPPRDGAAAAQHRSPSGAPEARRA